MGLLVTVTAYNGLPPQHPASVRVSDQKLVLGRHPDCQLELPDPECSVSGRHAMIAPLGDGYAITDVSTNGTFLNDSPDPIPPNHPVILNDGDRFSIGPYLLRVAFEPSSASAFADPFAMAPPPIEEEAALPGIPEPSNAADIMDLLDPGSSALRPVASQSVSGGGGGFTGLGEPPLLSEHSGERAAASSGSEGPRPSIEHMHLGVPTTAPAADASPAPGVPDDYDLLSDAFIPPDADQPLDSEQSDEPATETLDLAPAPETAFDMDLPEFSPVDRGAVATDSTETEEETDEQTALFAPVSTAGGSVREIDASPRQTEVPAPPVAPNWGAPDRGVSGELGAFLAGLGVSDADAIQDPEAFLRTSGQLLRAATEGMIAVMMARASFKSELRLEVTTIRSRENNPFQFCVDADDALDRLLLRRSRGFLDPTAAVHKTFDDIQAHQMAMIAGLRAALKALLSRFEPERLEKHFDGESHLDKLLPMARKSKCWDLFVSTFDQVADDASDDFMRLFGDAFNSAYEEQVRRLAEAKRDDSG